MRGRRVTSDPSLPRFGETPRLLCISDGRRTIELDGKEVGRGHLQLSGFHDALSDESADLLWRIDFGWMALAVVVALFVFATAWWQVGSMASRAKR